MSFEIPEPKRRRIRDKMLAVLDNALPAHRWAQVNLFESEEERIINRDVDRWLYEPALPYGGRQEAKWVERLKKLARKRDWFGYRMASIAAKKWEQILGWYYICKPTRENTDKEVHKVMLEKLKDARENRNRDVQWFCELMLKGPPERVADFRMDCCFLLHKHDGTTDRMVRLRNVLGQLSPIVPLDAESLSQPKQFRIWLNNLGRFHFMTGERDLQALQCDVDRDAAYEDVMQIVSIGSHELGGTGSCRECLWFFGDICLDPEGNTLSPDEQGIYWYKGHGYMLSKEGREGAYTQGIPMLRPDLTVKDIKQPVTDVDGKEIPEPTEQQALASFFREFCRRIEESVGGYDGWLVIGSILSYGAAPEVFHHYKALPGLWIHGQQGSGKTVIMMWMMNIWGFMVNAGLDMNRRVTAFGMQMANEQYSNLPVWLDEFRRVDVGEDKLGILRSAFNRGSESKYRPSGMRMKFNTMFVVSGETTTDDAATRSRYALVQMAATKRKGNHLEWFREHAGHLVLFGRYILQHRREYAALVLKRIEEWCARKDLPPEDDRLRMVYGLPYAAIMALIQMLESHGATETRAFAQEMVKCNWQAVQDVKSDVNINLFWDDLLSGFQHREIPADCFRVERIRTSDRTLGVTDPWPWVSYALYIHPDFLISKMEQWMAKRHTVMALKRSDIRDQLSKENYWLPGPHPVRFRVEEGNYGGTKKAWAIDVDRHPLGLQAVTDEHFQQYVMNQDKGDPRKGELFDLVDALVEREKNAQRERSGYTAGGGPGSATEGW